MTATLISTGPRPAWIAGTRLEPYSAWKPEANLKRISETETVIKRILPYLQRRGYNVDSDMTFEEPAASDPDHPRKGFIDIQMKCGRLLPQFLIEAKRDGTNITAAHRKQALEYGEAQNVFFVALTNGRQFELLNTATKKPLLFNG